MSFQLNQCVDLYQLKHWALEIIPPCIILDEFDERGAFCGSDGGGKTDP